MIRNRDEELDLSVLLASGVHNLKNSIAAFVGAVDGASIRIDNEVEAHQFRQTLGYLRKSHDDLVLLDLYKLGKSLYPLDIAPYSIDEIIHEALLYFQPATPGGLNISVVCDADLFWYLDRELIITSLCNAIENALRHAREEIAIVACSQDGWLEIQVADDGPGFPAHLVGPECLQSPHAWSGDHSTGLGLLFAAAIARVHKDNAREGQLKLANTGPCGGGRFILRLP